MALQIAEMLRAAPRSESSVKAIRSALRAFYRFLDSENCPDGAAVQSVRDVKDVHGPMFCRWLSGKSISQYGRAKTALDQMRQVAGLGPLFWPARTGGSISVLDTVDELGMRRLFNALKYEARLIKSMFREGERLAERGRDPRGRCHRDGFEPASWHHRENHAWLVKELTSVRLPVREEFIGCGAGGLNKANDPDRQKHNGPAYLAPGMSARGTQGFVGKLRWFHPSYADTGIFLWLFLLGTGWNLSTALAIDISEDESWHHPHPHNPHFTVLHAFKNRADRYQFTLSMRRPEWHPYRILVFMIERTRVLRATIRHRLETARRRYRAEASPANAAHVRELESMLKSPWLYHVINKTGEVGAFHHEDSYGLNELIRCVTEKHGLLEAHRSLARMTTSIARDAWIGHAYVQSGYHVLLTRLASQHANARTLKHYLRSRRYRAHSEEQIRKVQDAVFREIANGRIIDPTRIRLLVSNGTLTEEQERRLLDLRQRTRLGMGCLNPRYPPRRIAPEHKQGELCRVQRCTGCRHGIVFAESLGPLARAYAELLHIHRQIPLAAWSGSSLEEEFLSLEGTLKSFDSATVAAAVRFWSTKLDSGEAMAHDVYPSY